MASNIHKLPRHPNNGETFRKWRVNYERRTSIVGHAIDADLSPEFFAYSRNCLSTEPDFKSNVGRRVGRRNAKSPVIGAF
ncbi:hypothetical protein QN379_23450, partial [Glaciimonas sp. Gout2]|uniref:hypothetical protein n=1 Tax=Glaciimonas sp. Gout2 TaxID=3048625 RepID=UPI002B221B7B